MFKYETHLHTDETSPCGRVPAVDAVRIYKKAGYAGIVVTDHYTRGFFERQLFKSWNTKVDLYLAGYHNALEEGARLGLDVHLGMEIQFNENPNDYLVYGFDEQFLRDNKKLYRLGLRDFRKLTDGKGIAIIQAHPFRPRMTPADPSHLDGIEIYNGNPRHDSQNHLALKYAQDNGLKMLSGSDFHQVQDAARGGIIVGERIKPGGFAQAVMESASIDCIQT